MKYSYNDVMEQIGTRGREMLLAILNQAQDQMKGAWFGQRKKLKNRLTAAKDKLLYGKDMDEGDLEIMTFGLEWIVTNFRMALSQDNDSPEKTESLMNYIDELNEMKDKIEKMQ
ncbi:MAG: hypothetical protein J5744_01195 [Oscillospiraceae bacterium]|nr:hypothetical protein [Oscillospiraceae bacterium]